MFAPNEVTDAEIVETEVPDNRGEDATRSLSGFLYGYDEQGQYGSRVYTVGLLRDIEILNDFQEPFHVELLEGNLLKANGLLIDTIAEMLSVSQTPGILDQVICSQSGNPKMD